MSLPEHGSGNRRASVLRALLIYCGGAFGILQGVDMLIDRMHLPGNLFTATLVVLILGLPLVLITAYVQQRAKVHDTTAPARVFTWRNAALAGVAAFAMLGVYSVGRGAMRAINGDSENWARSTGLLEIKRLTDAGKFDSAYALGKRVGAVIGDDSTFVALRLRYAARTVVKSDPAGATVSRRPFTLGQDTTSEMLGVTPTDSIWMPRGSSVFTLVRAGYMPQEFAANAAGAAARVNELVPESDRDTGMVRIRADSARLQTPGLDHLGRIPLGAFMIDRHEVTNAEYKKFVDAGGYAKPEYWTEPFRRDGRVLAFPDAVKFFVDKTGQLGPSTWDTGDFGAGKENHPVSGVSWYEASAYARFAGKQLPTIYHWYRVAGTQAGANIVPLGNFGGNGTVSRGTTRSLSPSGVYDMAGNVREWCSNAGAPGERYILGGGYDDAVYQFVDAFAMPEWDRSTTNGIRLVKVGDTTGLTLAQRPISRPHRDFLAEKRSTDAEFAIYSRLYEYDRRPLNARIESTDSTNADFVVQVISFDAGYRNERMLAHFYLPRGARAPLQPIIMFPGSGALFLTSSAEPNREVNVALYLVKTGRALILPIYKGTFERIDDLQTDYPSRTSAWREHVVAWVTDYRRTIDYVETRHDLDASRVVYFGSSWGGAMGAIIPALEPRIKAVILRVAGIPFQETYPEVDAVTFAPHVKQPVIMLNGRYDHFFPVETSQKPLLKLLGTPDADKHYLLYEAGHEVPREMLVRESLAFLTKYTGAVGN